MRIIRSDIERYIEGHCKSRRNAGYSSAIHNKYNEYRRNTQKKDRQWELNIDQAAIIFKSDCHYCGDPPKSGKKLNGIDRVDNSIGYTPANCVPCCSTCNWMKNSFTIEEFIDKARKIANKHPRA